MPWRGAAGPDPGSPLAWLLTHARPLGRTGPLDDTAPLRRFAALIGAAPGLKSIILTRPGRRSEPFESMTREM